MHQANTAPPFPRIALFGAVALVGMTIVSAGASRLLGQRQPRPVAQVLMARDLTFNDRSDGSVAVIDASNGGLVDVLAPGTNGFIRASLRSLGSRRRLSGDTNQVFHLAALSDGRLTLDDPTTGNPIELEAFGETNEAAFARLLTDGGPAR